jgi:hypothetical protein
MRPYYSIEAKPTKIKKKNFQSFKIKKIRRTKSDIKLNEIK